MTQFAAVPFFNEEAKRIMKKFLKDTENKKPQSQMTRKEQIEAFEEEVRENLRRKKQSTKKPSSTKELSSFKKIGKG